MALKAGDRLGSFEVLSAIGAGGQGEVYKARDTRLDRNVAIKVLPAHLSARQDVRERFEREARTVSSLNHPHICTLYDIGAQDDVHFLVMEYLEGQTLADRLAKGQLPLADALRYAIEIADALDKAHRQGVVHRDLKPGNIMITKSGTKLLDFGLAKQGAVGSPAGAVHSAMPTAGAAPLTAEGTILGTLQYMSPEQLEGHEADARSDIFAFGSVLYEMATGRRAFEGKSRVSLMAAILEHDPPPISWVQPVSPKSLDYLVKSCLRKDPDRRYQTMADVLLRLEEIAESAETEPAAVTPRSRLRVAWSVAAILFMVSAALAIFVLSTRETPSAPKLSFNVETPSALNSLSIALSPDGKHLVAIVSEGGRYSLWLRALESLKGRIIYSGDEYSTGGAPFWSPDSRFITFAVQGKMRKLDVFGAPPQTICDLPKGGGGGTWNKKGLIIFGSTAGPLYRISASGGTPTPLTELDKSREETGHRLPMFLPDGEHYLFVAISAKPENSGIYLGSLDSKERTRLLASTQQAMYAPPGYLLFLRDTTLMAQSFNVKRLEMSGDPFPVVEGVGVNPINSVAGFTVSSNGLLAYRSTASAEETQLQWFDRTGNQTGTNGNPGFYTYPVLAPDLQRVAFTKREGDAFDIWIKGLVRDAETKFTFDGTDAAPMWSPDGSRIVYRSNRDGGIYNLYQKHSGGVGSEDVLLKSDHTKSPQDWSLDGKFILYGDTDPKTGVDLWVLPMTGDGKPGKAQPILQTQFNENEGQFSPDAKWIAYISDESKSNQVYVQSFPISGTKYQISTNGGYQPRWRRDGKELFFLSTARELMAVEISTSKDGVFHAGVPQKLFQTNVANFLTNRNSYDVTPDGQRFLINSPTASAASTPITVIVNWMTQSQPAKAP
jgi:serine/threonine protein kinase